MIVKRVMPRKTKEVMLSLIDRVKEAVAEIETEAAVEVSVVAEVAVETIRTLMSIVRSSILISNIRKFKTIANMDASKVDQLT